VNKKHSLSVVVLTCDPYTKKFGCIDHTLMALFNQQNVDVEFIVVDNGRNEEDHDKLAQFLGKSPQTTSLVHCSTSIAEARNTGASQAKGDTIVFVDEDSILTSNTTLSAVSELAATTPHGYGAHRLWTPSISWFKNHAAQLFNEISSGNYHRLLDGCSLPPSSIRNKDSVKYLVRSFIGNFGYVNRDSFVHLGGFPTCFKGYGLEDDAFAFLCYLHLGKPANLQQHTIIHVTHPLGKTFQQEYEENLLLYRGFLQTYGYAKFHIGDLLYPETESYRPVAELIQVKETV